ncbi:MAG: metallophosphoesterase [Ignavibacteria bacterium]|nr:metallophosphoesterase [Ignavibacteria bacterium]
MDRRKFIFWIPAAFFWRPTIGLAAHCTVANQPAAPHFDLVQGALWDVKLAVLGDWGTGGALQKRVGQAMYGQHSLIGGFNAVVSTGDNIYPNGVSSATDVQWQRKYLNMYPEQLLQLKWIAVLGNHDYRKSADAQIEFGELHKKWIMPSKFYSYVIGSNARTAVTIVAIDTQQLLTRSDGWQVQLEWLRRTLEGVKTKWKVVVGHHPTRSYGLYGDQDWMLKSVKPIMDAAGVQAYLCGHDHDLQIIKHPDDGFHCIVSGAGGGCRSTAYGKHTLAAATNGGFVTWQSNEQKAMIQIVDDKSLVKASVVISA